MTASVREQTVSWASLAAFLSMALTAVLIAG